MGDAIISVEQKRIKVSVLEVKILNTKSTDAQGQGILKPKSVIPNSWGVTDWGFNIPNMKNKNYYVVRNARCTYSRYTLKLYLSIN